MINETFEVTTLTSHRQLAITAADRESEQVFEANQSTFVCEDDYKEQISLADYGAEDARETLRSTTTVAFVHKKVKTMALDLSKVPSQLGRIGTLKQRGETRAKEAAD